jgi:hypothetical protein
VQSCHALAILLIMTQYTILPVGDGSGFNVAVSGSDGARNTMLGFASEEEAEAWIALDKRLDGVDASPVALPQPGGDD